MENINEIIQSYLEIPVVQIVISVLMCLYAFLKIFGCTSLGKKALNKLAGLHNSSRKDYEYLTSEYENFKRNKKEEIEEIKKEYELKLYTEKEYQKAFEKFVVNALGQINNDKVKKVIAEFDFTRNDNPVLIEEIEKAKQQVRDEYEDKINYLLKKVEEIENGKEKDINGTPEEEQI